jgi:hypothetical protein
MLEEDAFFDGEKTWYIDPRMEELSPDPAAAPVTGLRSWYILLADT